MANDIVPSLNRPRAIAKEKDGIVLYWVEELSVAGLHIRGIETLLQTETATVRNVIASLQGAQIIKPLEVEILTTGGIQGAQIITESDLSKVLRKIERSKAKEETRDLAGDIRDRLASAGFKLMVMLELAPQHLSAPAVPVPIQRDPIEYIEAAKTLENLKDPLMRSLLSQRLYEVLQGQSALPGTAERLVCVAVRAGELGFRLGQGEDSLLGKYIKARFQPEGQLPPGRYQVNAYKLTPQLDEAIRSFFYALSGEN